MTKLASRSAWIAYFRVSTDKQGRSGLGLEAQQEAVRAFLEGRSDKLIAEIIEIESGGRADRPKLAEALRLCRVHQATLIIAKLDRLARNVAFVSHLMESGVDFVAVDFPTANRLTIHILAAVAEHEASMIRDRTRLALAAARARGVRLGGDRGHLAATRAAGVKASARARHLLASNRAADLGPILLGLQNEGRSLRQIAAALGERGIGAARGGVWSACAVSRILRRYRDGI